MGNGLNKRKEKAAIKEKTIKNEIKGIIYKLLITSLLLVGIISSILNFIAVRYTLEKCMHEMAFVAAHQIQYRLHDIINPVEIIGSHSELTSEELTDWEKQALLDVYVKHYGWELMHITDEKGNVVANSALNVSNRDYFKAAIEGGTGITEPFYSDEVEKMVVVVSTPLWKDGKIDTEIEGIVFAAVDANDFTEWVSEIKVSDNGAAYIIDAQGNTIAHENFALVESYSNTIKEAEADSKLKQLAKLEQQMLDGKDGFGKYSYGGVTKYMAYAPIGINGWSIAITTPATDFNGNVLLSVLVMIIVLVVAISASAKIANKYGSQIGDAISVCAKRLKLLAEGDLKTEVPVIVAEDETKILAESTAKIVATQHSIIGDAKHLLNEMSRGNFCVKSVIGVDSYVGEYEELLAAMRSLRDDMTRILWAIVEAAEQVDAGSEQLACASQELAEGSTAQTGVVDELLNTVTLVTEQVEVNKVAADEAHDGIRELAHAADLSNKKMSELTAEMSTIERASAEISNIITEIESIASQTNLLSLNASIEAARAGEAGRGFAVVADQIGKLAEQSAKSAVNTKHLIETSIQEINKGSKITTETAVQLESMIDGLKGIVGVIEKVRVASDSQAEAIVQIKSEVAKISDVAQSNSAAAEETSATSEELSAQAQMMDELVVKFHLPKEL